MAVDMACRSDDHAEPCDDVHEMREQPRVVRAAMGTERKAIKGMYWGMRKDHADWSADQINTMYRLQRSNLKSARAWRLKEALRSS